MNIVLFDADEIGKAIALSDERARHILLVLHKREGDTFDAGIINGQAGRGRITRIDEDAPNERGAGTKCASGRLFFEFTPESDGKPLFPLTVIIGFPRPIQLKRIFRDMAGLGVSAIHLTGTALGEKSYLQSTLVERGAAFRLLVEGSAQAKSTHIPELTVHECLADCLKAVPSKTNAPLLVACDNVRPTKPLRNALGDFFEGGILRQENPRTPSRSVWAAIGSERGWTEDERDMLCAAGFTLCGMGSRVLRTETAATVASALILAAMETL